jgi:hypothetical protein
MGRVDLGFGAGLGFDRSDDAGRIDTEQVKVAKPRCHVDVGCVSILHGARREEPWRSLTYVMLPMRWVSPLLYVVLLYWAMTKGREEEEGVGWGGVGGCHVACQVGPGVNGVNPGGERSPCCFSVHCFFSYCIWIHPKCF